MVELDSGAAIGYPIALCSSISFLHILYLSFRYEKWSPNGQDYKLTLPRNSFLFYTNALELFKYKVCNMIQSKESHFSSRFSISSNQGQ